MDLRHLRYFVAVAEELHFAHAAERLNITPPTLTVQIQELEHSLSVRLFARDKRNVALTRAGEVFLPQARAVLARFDMALNAGRRAGRGEIGRVEVGYVGTAVYSGVLQEQISRFRHDFPEVEIVASERVMGELPDLVAEGHIDIGFVRLPMTIPPTVRQHVLIHDHFCAAIPEDHPLARPSGALRAEELAGEPLVVPEQQAGTYEVARRGRFSPHIVADPGRIISVLTEVSLGTGIAVLPNAVRDIVHLPNLVFREIAGDRIGSEIAAIFRAREESAAAMNFIAQIKRSPARRLPRGDIADQAPQPA